MRGESIANGEIGHLHYSTARCKRCWAIARLTMTDERNYVKRKIIATPIMEMKVPRSARGLIFSLKTK